MKKWRSTICAGLLALLIVPAFAGVAAAAPAAHGTAHHGHHGKKHRRGRK